MISKISTWKIVSRLKELWMNHKAVFNLFLSHSLKPFEQKEMLGQAFRLKRPEEAVVWVPKLESRDIKYARTNRPKLGSRRN